MDAKTYLDLKDRLIEAGYADEIDWAEGVEGRGRVHRYAADADEWWCEYAYVILNSGMKQQIAAGIWRRIWDDIRAGNTVEESVAQFGHKGKRGAMLQGYKKREEHFAKWQSLRGASDEEKLEWLRSLPWIGKITCYHLAKNLGMDIIKPDRHLVRIAAEHHTEPFQMCRRLSDELGENMAVVDMVLWRAANLGWV